MRIIVPVIFLALVVVAPLAGQAPPDSSRTGAVAGQVLDATTRSGVSAASVLVVGTDRQVRSGPDGRFLLSGVPVGIHVVRIAAIGYQPVALANVAVGSGKPAVVAAELHPVSVMLQEITVAAEYFRPAAENGTSTQSLGEEDVRRSPGVAEDILLAAALLPGVAPVTSGGRNDLAIRGGAPFENLFLVDNVEVPNINHFGAQGSSGGSNALVNVDLVQDLTLSTGGFGARYGDRTASVTSVSLREGSRQPSAKLNLSATGFSAVAEGPLGPDGSVLFSVRRSYLDLLFKAFGLSFIPSYWDFSVKAVHGLGRAGRLSFVTIGAIDQVHFNDATADDRYDNSRILAPDLRQYFAGLTWQRPLPKGVATVTLGRTFSRFVTEQRDSLGGLVLGNRSEEGETSLRAEVQVLPSPAVELTLGNAVRYASRLSYRLTLLGFLRRDVENVPSPLNVDTTIRAWRNATYGQVALNLGRRVRATGGLRLDWYGFLASAARLSPRAALAVVLDGRTTLNIAGGRYTQAPSYVWLVGDPTNAAALRPFRADQVIVGVERRVRPDLKVQVETYVKSYAGYPARRFRPQAVLQPSGFGDVQTDIPFGLEPLASEGEGRAYGIELFAQKRFSEVPVYGLVSLSVGRAEFAGLDGVRRPGSFDTRFIGTVSAGWRFRPRWEVSGRLQVATGLPTTPFITTGPAAGSLDFARYNAARLPVFHQLDVRLDRRWSFQRWQFAAYLDVANVYGRANVSSYRWDQRAARVETQRSFGVLPSIGMMAEF